MGRNDTIA